MEDLEVEKCLHKNADKEGEDGDELNSSVPISFQFSLAYSLFRLPRSMSAVSVIHQRLHSSSALSHASASADSSSIEFIINISCHSGLF